MGTKTQPEIKKALSKDLIVKTNTVLGSTYAQIVGVVVNDSDLTLEFVYLNPRPGTKEAQVVARITLPRIAAEGIVKAITDTIAEHELKKKVGKDGTN